MHSSYVVGQLEEDNLRFRAENLGCWQDHEEKHLNLTKKAALIWCDFDLE